MIKHSKVLHLVFLVAIVMALVIPPLSIAIPSAIPNNIEWFIATVLVALLLSIRFYEGAKENFYGKMITPDMLKDGEYRIHKIASEYFEIWQTSKNSKNITFYDVRVLIDSRGIRQHFPENLPTGVDIIATINTEITKLQKKGPGLTSTDTTVTTIKRVINCAWGDQKAQQVAIMSSSQP